MIRFNYPGAPRIAFDADRGGGGDLDLRSLGTALENHAGATQTALADLLTRAKNGDGRLSEVERALARLLEAGGVPASRSVASDVLARTVGDSDQFKLLTAGKADKAMIPVSAAHFLETRNTITSATSGDSIAPTLAPQRLDGIFAGPERKTWLHQLMPQVPAIGGSIEYVRESAYTNNAAAQASEGAAKEQSSITLTLEEAKVATIAHWLKSSRQALSDSNALRQYLDRRLRYGTLLALESQIVAGTGAAGTIKGLTHADNHTAYAGGMVNDQAADAIRRAIGQLDATDFVADVVVLHPDDWTEMELLKDAEERYLIGDPKGSANKQLWTKMVHTTPALPYGKFMVAALGQATQFHPREDANLIVALDGDDLTKNLVTLLAELRATMTVPQPGGVIYGDLPENS